MPVSCGAVAAATQEAMLTEEGERPQDRPYGTDEPDLLEQPRGEEQAESQAVNIANGRQVPVLQPMEPFIVLVRASARLLRLPETEPCHVGVSNCWFVVTTFSAPRLAGSFQTAPEGREKRGYSIPRWMRGWRPT